MVVNCSSPNSPPNLVGSAFYNTHPHTYIYIYICNFCDTAGAASLTSVPFLLYRWWVSSQAGSPRRMLSGLLWKTLRRCQKSIGRFWPSPLLQTKTTVNIVRWLIASNLKSLEIVLNVVFVPFFFFYLMSQTLKVQSFFLVISMPAVQLVSMLLCWIKLAWECLL